MNHKRTDDIKHQSSALLAVREVTPMTIRLDSLHKGPVTRKAFLSRWCHHRKLGWKLVKGLLKTHPSQYDWQEVWLIYQQRKFQWPPLLWRHNGCDGEFPHKWPVTRKMFPFDDVIMGLLMVSGQVKTDIWLILRTDDKLAIVILVITRFAVSDLCRPGGHCWDRYKDTLSFHSNHCFSSEDWLHGAESYELW